VTGKPIPVPDELTRPYWDAANEGRLVIQRCGGCTRYHHPPVAICPACACEALAFEEVSGNGEIHALTVTHDARTPAFAAIQPYLIVWVALDEQPGLVLMTNILGSGPDDVRIGARVEVCFEEIAPGVHLPQFRLTARD
jgi:uncharacterized OB-fold protein